MSNLLKGARLYTDKMTGMESFGVSSTLKTFLKAVFTTGFGEQVIDKIDGKTITINKGYNIVDDYVIYEIFNDSASVLTTLKKIDANNFESGVDLSSISGACSIRVPPIGLEFSENEDGTHQYKVDENKWFIVKDSQIGVKIGDFSLYAGSRYWASVTAFVVSSREILTNSGMHCGFATDNTAFASMAPEYLRSYYTSNGSISFKETKALFPAVGFVGGAERSTPMPEMKTSATVFSKCYIGLDRSEIESLRKSSSDISYAVDFVFENYQSTAHQIFHAEKELVAVLFDGSQSVYCAKLGELPK